MSLRRRIRARQDLSWKIYLMVGIKVQITKYIDDDPQPGTVECRLFDFYRKEWVFQMSFTRASSAIATRTNLLRGGYTTICRCVAFVAGSMSVRCCPEMTFTRV